MRAGALLGAALALAAATQPAASAGGAHAEQVEAYFREHVEPWLSSDEILNALRNQNAESRRLSRSEIRTLDEVWRNEIATEGISGPTIRRVMDRPISQYLKERQEAADWMMVEIILMDSKGLSVGLSKPSSDYWQGDEAKFMMTFALGNEEPHVDIIEYEASTGLLISQINSTVFDPDTGRAIGAITVGINMNKL